MHNAPRVPHFLNRFEEITTRDKPYTFECEIIII